MSLDQSARLERETPPPAAGMPVLGPDTAACGGRMRRPGLKRADPGAAGPGGLPEDWIAAIAARQDREAFKRLFAAFAPRLKAFARRMGAEGAAAEDLAQDVMLTVWRRAPQFDRDKAAVSTWIYTIARNRRIDMIRREARPDFDAEDPSLKGDAEPLADAQLESSRRAADLRKAVAGLPEEQARLMRLAYFEDKSHGVIADELDLPLGTVKSRIRLAMRKLRQMMKEDD